MLLSAVSSSLSRHAVGRSSSFPNSSFLDGANTMTKRTIARMVRIICIKDLPCGKEYAGSVVHVKAGYARNHLIPQKYAKYATRENFEKLGMKDPDFETVEEKRERLERERLEDKGSEDAKAADILKTYLRNKVLTMYRRVDEDGVTLFPGMVDTKAIRQKLLKQLRIQLEPHEKIFVSDRIIDDSVLTGPEIQSIVDAIPMDEPCTFQVKKKGMFLAKILLRGGYTCTLKVNTVATNKAKSTVVVNNSEPKTY